MEETISKDPSPTATDCNIGSTIVKSIVFSYR